MSFTYDRKRICALRHDGYLRCSRTTFLVSQLQGRAYGGNWFNMGLAGQFHIILLRQQNNSPLILVLHLSNCQPPGNKKIIPCSGFQRRNVRVAKPLEKFRWISNMRALSQNDGDAPRPHGIDGIIDSFLRLIKIDVLGVTAC